MTGAADSAAPRGVLAYLTTEYPNVSHTFIRREILGLERLGFTVRRFALRRGKTIVDPEDRSEDARSLQLLNQPKLSLLLQILRGLLRARLRLIPALLRTWRLGKASERGMLVHVGYLLEALAFRDLFARENIRHVHVHFGTNIAAVALLVKTMGGPTFSVTVHGPDEFDAPLGFSLGLKVRESAFTIAISHYGAAQIRRWVPHEHWHKLHIVRCTVGADWFQSARTPDPKADALVCVGRLSAQKGQLLLIDALAEAVRRGFHGRLILIGDGELRPAIEARIAHHRLESVVTLTGWADAETIRTHLLAARAMVLPSFAEGLPVVIMEAMALQRPVLTTTIAGIPELVTSGVNGWLTASGDVAALADALLEVAATAPEQIERLGRAGADRVREQHDQMRECEKLATLFDAVLPPVPAPDGLAVARN